MTAQVSDIFKYRGKKYNIVGLQGIPPFDPKDFGLVANSSSTACWRGFWCAYGIKDDRLMLDELYLHNEKGNYPPLNGVEVAPIEYDEATVYGREGKSVELVPKYMGHRVYCGVDLFFNYTGTILIGADFDHRYYRHMGFQQYWGYKKLIELSFEDGKLVSEADRSEDAAEKRTEIDGGRWRAFSDDDFHAEISEDVRKTAKEVAEMMDKLEQEILDKFSDITMKNIMDEFCDKMHQDMQGEDSENKQ